MNNEDSCKFEPKVMTNADRIRAMSDEELGGVTNLPCIRCNPGGCENRKEGADNG